MSLWCNRISLKPENCSRGLFNQWHSTARQWSCRKVMFSVISVCRSVCLSVHGGALMWPLPMMFWTTPYRNLPSNLWTWDLTLQGPASLDMGSHCTGTPPTGTDQDWKPSWLLGDPHLCWHLVAIEAHVFSASEWYASYWNAFFFCFKHVYAYFMRIILKWTPFIVYCSYALP